MTDISPCLLHQYCNNNLLLLCSEEVGTKRIVSVFQGHQGELPKGHYIIIIIIMMHGDIISSSNNATITVCRGLCTYRVSQQSMSHLVSQDKSELVNICYSVQHPRKHEHFPVLHKGKYKSEPYGV